MELFPRKPTLLFACRYSREAQRHFMPAIANKSHLRRLTSVFKLADGVPIKTRQSLLKGALVLTSTPVYRVSGKERACRMPRGGNLSRAL